jgi:hypothetical protein
MASKGSVPPHPSRAYRWHRGAFSFFGGATIVDIVVALGAPSSPSFWGITVHPVFLFIIGLAVVYLVVRHRSRA